MAAATEALTQTRAVSNYLESLEASKPRRGRKPDVEKLRNQLAEIEDALTKSPSPMKRLDLLTRKDALTASLASLDVHDADEALKADFIKYAKTYGERKAISYATWRSVGVAADVLAEAGITR